MTYEDVIPAVVGMSLFGIPTGYLLTLLFCAVRSRRWPGVPGKIVRSAVNWSKNRNQASYNVSYEYEVNGTKYSNSVVRFGGFLNFNSADARKTVARYPQGSQVTVYYNPSAPEKATLERRASGFLIMWVIIGAIVVGSILYGLIMSSTGYTEWPE